MHLLAVALNLGELWILPILLLVGAFAVLIERAKAQDPPQPCWRCGAATHHKACDYLCPKCGWSFQKDGRFRIPVRSSPLSACRLRRYCDADFEACVEIYRLNEPGRFPMGPHHIEEFRGALRDGRTLFIVCEVDGIVRGCGGISKIRLWKDMISLSYGMVHPSYYGRGLGTVLLLGRLSLLRTEDDIAWIPSMGTVEVSAPFYARFGFSGKKTTEEDGTVLWYFYSCLYSADVERCRSVLADAGVTNQCLGADLPFTEQRDLKQSEVEPGKREGERP